MEATLHEPKSRNFWERLLHRFRRDDIQEVREEEIEYSPTQLNSISSNEPKEKVKSMDQEKKTKSAFRIGLISGLKKDPTALQKQLDFYDSQISISRKQYEDAQNDITDQFDQLSTKTDNILKKFHEIFDLFNESQEKLVDNIRKAVLNFLPDEYPPEIKKIILEKLVDAHIQEVAVLQKGLEQASSTLTNIVAEFKDSKWTEASLAHYKENVKSINKIIQSKGEFKEGFVYGESISQE